MVSNNKKQLPFGFRLFFKYLAVKRFIFLKLFSNARLSLSATRIVQPTQFLGDGEILIGKSQIGFWPSPHLLAGISYLEVRSATAKIIIGDDTIINNNAIITAERSSIKIGDRCLIGHGFCAIDSDFHGLTIADRTSGNYECLPVEIGNDVLIGADVKVLKGVTIGDGAVIGAGSIISGDVPPNAVVVSGPARILGYLDN